MNLRVMVVVLALLACLPNHARAECIAMNADRAMTHELVFSGTVIEIVRTAGFGYRATFEVDRVWKGQVTKLFPLYVWELSPERPRWDAAQRYLAVAERVTDAELRLGAGITDPKMVAFTPVECSDPPSLAKDLRQQLGPGYAPMEPTKISQAESAQPSPDAPFSVIRSSGPQVRVDIGGERSRSWLLRSATVVGPFGGVGAKLVRVERKCEVVCGEEDDPVCHFEAVLRASRPVDDALGVLPGTRRIGMVTRLERGSGRPIAHPEEWVTADPITAGTVRFRWERFPDGVFLTSNYSGRDFYAPPIQLSDCMVRPVSAFTVMTCPAAELLYEGKRGLVASFAEYGEQLVEPTVRFRLGGKDAVLLRLGVKGEVVAALLIKDENGWRLEYRPADYPTIC